MNLQSCALIVKPITINPNTQNVQIVEKVKTGKRKKYARQLNGVLMLFFKRKKREKKPLTIFFLNRVKREFEEGKPSIEMVNASTEHDCEALRRLGFEAFDDDKKYTVQQLYSIMRKHRWLDDWECGILTLPKLLERLNAEELNGLLISKQELLMWDKYVIMVNKYAEAVEEFSLHEHMKNSGLVITAFNCPKCEASLKLPHEGKEIICDYCKTVVYAKEVFEKIKRF